MSNSVVNAIIIINDIFLEMGKLGYKQTQADSKDIYMKACYVLAKLNKIILHNPASAINAYRTLIMQNLTEIKKIAKGK